MQRPILLAATLLLAALAGCSDAPDAPVDEAPPQEQPLGPFATIAVIDTGINPYHVDFRDASDLAYQHPSKYLPGYPADAIALPITLTAPDLESALEADEKLWQDVREGQLYWFPGTKIVGAYATDGPSTRPPIYDEGHGVMTASRAAGNAYSLCPECRIVAIQGFNGESVVWASQQPWIDLQTNSWAPAGGFAQVEGAQGGPLGPSFAEAAARHLVFASAGNGAAGKVGVLGHPTFTRSTSGAPGVIGVGGHDNGKVVLWTGTWPRVVADACDSWAAVGDTLDGYDPREGGGTSAASPYAAGAAGKIVLEARKVLGPGGRTDGILAQGAGASDQPLLADGDLTVAEAKQILFRTAVAPPVATEHDGEECSPASPYNTYPVEWSQIPPGTPTYPIIGYGQISIHSLEAALEVLAGAPLPERPEEDAWAARDDAIRDAYHGT